MQKTLKVLNIQDLRDLKPCGDPVHRFGLPEDWTGTIIDILKMESLEPINRIWVACYSKQVSDKTLRLFTVWNARRELALCEKTYPEAERCIDAAERYANGEGTLEELLSAQKENRAADRAADLAAYLAAYRAAYLAAYRAAYLAAYRAADRAQQVNHLIGMIEAEYAPEEKKSKPVKRTYEGWLKKTITNPRAKTPTYTINGHHEMVLKAAAAAGLTVEELDHCYKITGAKSAQALNKLLKGTHFNSSSYAYGPCDLNIYQVMVAS